MESPGNPVQGVVYRYVHPFLNKFPRPSCNAHPQVADLLGAVATRRAQRVAFAMGLLERLGARSRVRLLLDPALVRMVLDRV